MIRLRREGPNFLEAFETVLAEGYKSEHEDLSIVACGPMVPEAMCAAYTLNKEFGCETRVLNLHTLNPLTPKRSCGRPRIPELSSPPNSNQIGALAWRVSSLLTESPRLYALPVITRAIGVKDRFGDSGAHPGS